MRTRRSRSSSRMPCTWPAPGRGTGFMGEDELVGEHKLRQNGNSQNETKVVELAATISQKDLQLAGAEEAIKQHGKQIKTRGSQLKQVTTTRGKYAERIAFQNHENQTGQVEVRTVDAMCKLRAKLATLKE
ncbi:unnamed protein product [Prorocentrum cordatum]|uniref:Uncharacterized protein n=1 Tax=Prorocentrum cordatum TaxID=2364126 RepID=A0ABN9WYT6_9DINO|nr:unnamed protein product [Polarella glacialis]